MKLILASAGFYTAEIVEKCVELVGKPHDEINIAVINEAYAVEHGDHRWVLADLNRIQDNFAGSIEFVNLLALDLETVKARVALADVLFVVGGHTDYLMSVFKKTGFDTLLPQILKDKVYVGSSAGAMIIGNRVSTEAYQHLYGEANSYGITNYLGLVDVALKPHLNNPLFPNNVEEVLLRLTKDYSGMVYGLPDDAALIIDGDKQYIIGDKTIKIRDGQPIA